MENIKKLYSLCFPNKNAEAELKNIENYNYKIADDVCFVTYKITSDEEAEVYDVGTQPEHRNKGIAKNLINSLVAELKAAGVKTIFLEVAENNIAAIKLYENCGFTKYNTRKNYYNIEDKKINATLMRLFIN
jgi:ribosomal-protein-alanine N-acetyltransferase